MSIVSVHIRHKCLPLLPWNIIQGFSEACTLLELITAIKNGTLGPVDWTFPEKLTTCDVSATIGRNKIESFNKVMMSMNVVQTTALFGHYIRFELSDENDVRTKKRHNIGDKEDHVDSQRPTMGKRNAFQILLDGARKSTLPKPFDLNN